MKKYIILSFLLAAGWFALYGQSPAEKIVAYEYWFNATYAPQEVTLAEPAPQFTLTSVDAAALPEGVNTLYYRARDGAGNWSVVCSQSFVRSGAGITAPIVACEYWFDDDFAARRSITPDEAANSLLAVASLDVAHLSTGVHTLHFRALDDAGKWTVVRSRQFYRMPLKHSAGDNLIVAYRYWIDDRPAETVALAEPASPLGWDGFILIPDELDPAVSHIITIQFADDYDVWSEPRSSSFIIIPVTGIVAGFDPDEAVAAGVPLSLTATVEPDDASYQTIVWTVKDAGGTGAVITPVAGGYEFNATDEGTAVIVAAIANGLGGGNDFTEEFVLEVKVATSFIPVTDVTHTLGATLTGGAAVALEATVVPANATNQTIVWSVKAPNNTGAAIDGNQLTTAKGGSLTIVATIANGATPTTAFTKEFSFTVSPVTGIAELTVGEASVYPNPFDDAVRISMGVETWRTATLHVTNAAGVAVHTQTVASPDEVIRLGHLPAGVYLFRVEVDGRVMTIKAVKQ